VLIFRKLTSFKNLKGTSFSISITHSLKLSTRGERNSASIYAGMENAAFFSINSHGDGYNNNSNNK
jgi:hypothetical protein